MASHAEVTHLAFEQNWFDEPYLTNHTKNLQGPNHADYLNPWDLVIYSDNFA